MTNIHYFVLDCLTDVIDFEQLSYKPECGKQYHNRLWF